MRSYTGYLLFLALSLSLFSCQEPDTNSDTFELSFVSSVDDPYFRQVIHLANRQDLDSLAILAKAAHPPTRMWVARSLASLSDRSETLDVLSSLIQDQHVEVREAAAFALGQTGSASAQEMLLAAYDSEDSLRQHVVLNATILEAIGKCGSAEMLEFMSTISTFAPEDPFMLPAQMRAIYQFGLRSMVSEASTQRAVEVVTGPEYAGEARMMAANYLMRAKNLNLGPHLKTLLPTTINHKDPRVRMCLVRAIGTTGQADAMVIMKKMMDQDPDPRVKINLLRSLSAYTRSQTREITDKAFSQDHALVKLAALDYMLASGDVQDGQKAYEIYRTSDDWEIKYRAAAVANKYLSWRSALSRDQLNSQLKSALGGEDDAFAKKLILQALSHEVQNQRFIEAFAKKAGSPQDKTSSAEALLQLYQSDKFKSYFGGQHGGKLKQGLALLKSLMEDGDAGRIALISSTISAMESSRVKSFASVSELDAISEKLSLPRDKEAAYELIRLKSTILGQEAPPAKAGDVHPIAWDQLSDTMTAIINADRGEIRLRLWPGIAPATVANFADLANNGFYTDKRLHRVVPNFVVQDGCPRGDGYGSLDYLIRSEFSARHFDKAGYIGMASLGPHTEGTQWFLTHSPTPHLDGKYTIFGEIISGMDVLQAMRLGGVIKSIKIQ